ncbi:hypothetical protein E2C01_097616 [Portunus trituberculatus]|uniref:Uncharacterized protein n=1 Tax=Portunus trituberculatus TaxID=210409 RepID=A0A5B7JZ34_PORTR|nr:hypothetical protein [Portunus trituberculatus]
MSLRFQPHPLFLHPCKLSSLLSPYLLDPRPATFALPSSVAAFLAPLSPSHSLFTPAYGPSLQHFTFHYLALPLYALTRPSSTHNLFLHPSPLCHTMPHFISTIHKHILPPFICTLHPPAASLPPFPRTLRLYSQSFCYVLPALSRT